MTPTKTLRISLVAWGEKHVRLAKNVCLPSLLDPEIEVKLDVYTDLPGEFDFPTIKIGNNPERIHQLVSDCHRQSIGSRDPVVIACPDMVFGKGTLKAIQRLVDEGKRLVLVPSPRLDRGSVAPLLRSGMTNRELSALAIEHLHPGFDWMFWEKHPFTDTPYQIYWKRSGLVCRCFHMHPLLIWSEKKIRFTGTVDDDCVDLFNTESSYVVTDSDEIACFETSPSGYVWGQKVGDHKNIDQWIERKANRMHKWFFTHECHIHTGVKESVGLPKELQQYA